MNPRIFLIHSGDGFSTADVVTGLHAGLVANGARVTLGRLNDLVQVFSGISEIIAGQNLTADPPDALAMCAAPLVHQAVLTGPYDLAIAVTGLKLHPTVAWALRKLGIPTVLLCTESPYQTLGGPEQITERLIAQHYDWVFTNDPAALPLFANPPERVHYLPHAYNPVAHRPGPVIHSLRCDVAFVGTAFPERRALFGGVNWAGIDWQCRGTGWDEALSGENYERQVLDNAAAAALYRSAAITLNHHRTTGNPATGAPSLVCPTTLGPRAYEIAACGGFQLCDDSRPELSAVFGDTVPTYRADDSADLERQIRHWLANPHARAERAAAQYTAVQGHTWTARAATVLTTVLCPVPVALRTAAVMQEV
jgi:spore maturation protein CgeB